MALFSRRQIETTPQTALEKMQEGSLWNEWALGIFHDLHDDLVHSTALLKESIEDHTAEVDQITKHIATAKGVLAHNETVCAKLQEFVTPQQ